MIVVLESKRVDTRIDAKRLAYRDTAHALRDKGAPVRLIVRINVRCVIREVAAGAAHMIIAREIMVVFLDILLDVVVLEIITVVISEFVRLLFSHSRLRPGGGSHRRRR